MAAIAMDSDHHFGPFKGEWQDRESHWVQTADERAEQAQQTGSSDPNGLVTD